MSRSRSLPPHPIPSLLRIRSPSHPHPIRVRVRVPFAPAPHPILPSSSSLIDPLYFYFCPRRPLLSTPSAPAPAPPPCHPFRLLSFASLPSLVLSFLPPSVLAFWPARAHAYTYIPRTSSSLRPSLRRFLVFPSAPSYISFLPPYLLLPARAQRIHPPFPPLRPRSLRSPPLHRLLTLPLRPPRPRPASSIPSHRIISLPFPSLALHCIIHPSFPLRLFCLRAHVPLALRPPRFAPRRDSSLPHLPPFPLPPSPFPRRPPPAARRPPHSYIPRPTSPSPSRAHVSPPPPYAYALPFTRYPPSLLLLFLPSFLPPVSPCAHRPPFSAFCFCPRAYCAPPLFPSPLLSFPHPSSFPSHSRIVPLPPLLLPFLVFPFMLTSFAPLPSLAYFLPALPRLFAPAYTPTEQDIVQARARTIGITETVFRLREHEMLMVDVGGQKSERRKWIHCFQDVTSILFLVSLSGYDQCLVEDRDANQMQDAMTIWDSICHSQWFKQTSIILFLNKNDLFQKKIKTSDIRSFFPDFEGEPGSASAGLEYFKKRFGRLAQKAGRAKEREIYIHTTTATDTENLRVIMAAVEVRLSAKTFVPLCYDHRRHRGAGRQGFRGRGERGREG